MTASCLVCGSRNTHLESVVPDHLVSHESFDLYQCDDCGFKYINNPPSVEKIAKYYATEEYVEHSDSKAGIINGIYHYARKYMLWHKYKLLESYGCKKRILDFGTGTGYFLHYMKSKKYETIGIEINERARRHGTEKFGLDIRAPKQLLTSGFPGKYGYVTFWHVLEHIYNVDEVMSRLHELLLPEGKLIVALPNHNCFEAKVYSKYWNGYDVPRHLWHWDMESFTRFVEKHNYKIVETKLLPLDPFYNCLISESYRKSLLGYLMFPLFGSWSLLKGWLNHAKASSIIYVLQKA